MKDKMNIPDYEIIPDYDFKVNNSCGALERIMHDQKNPPHMLQTIHPNQVVKETDIVNKGNTIDYEGDTLVLKIKKPRVLKNWEKFNKKRV